MNSIDILFINPGRGENLYQSLQSEYSAIEPPAWINYLSNYLNRNGHNAKILDLNVYHDSQDDFKKLLLDLNPKIICLGIFGQHPSASTQTMVVARKTVDSLIKIFGSIVPKILMIGPHPSALPRKTLEQENIDFVIVGDAFDSTKMLIEAAKSNFKNLDSIPGLYYKIEVEVYNKLPQKIDNNIDDYFKEADWHQLPMEKYRAHNWHILNDVKNRSPYAAIYTSLGCPYNCDFCCINVQYGKRGIRYRSPHLVVEELKLLNHKYGIKNIKIIDELFIFNKKHYVPILEGIIENNLDLNIWAYARVDSIDTSDKHLDLIKKAGVNWLALGIESANTTSSEKLKKIDVVGLVEKLKQHEINVIGNYIFGLTNETKKDIEKTYELSTLLNTEYINYYCTMAYPGTNLYTTLQNKGANLSEDWSTYSQLACNAIPLSNKNISRQELLSFRDQAFKKYFSRDSYKKMIERRFGKQAIDHINKMLTKNLVRD